VKLFDWFALRKAQKQMEFWGWVVIAFAVFVGLESLMCLALNRRGIAAFFAGHRHSANTEDGRTETGNVDQAQLDGSPGVLGDEGDAAAAAGQSPPTAIARPVSASVTGLDDVELTPYLPRRVDDELLPSSARRRKHARQQQQLVRGGPAVVSPTSTAVSPAGVRPTGAASIPVMASTPTPAAEPVPLAEGAEGVVVATSVHVTDAPNGPSVDDILADENL
jgi:hypothetical protein